MCLLLYVGTNIKTVAGVARDTNIRGTVSIHIGNYRPFRIGVRLACYRKRNRQVQSRGAIYYVQRL